MTASTVAGGFGHLAKAAGEGLWEIVTASCKYLESSVEQTKWSCMRGSNRPLFLSAAFRQTPKILFLNQGMKCNLDCDHS